MWWDADLQKELVEAGDGEDEPVSFRLSDYPARAKDLEIRAPADTLVADRRYLRIIAVADILGDWREELLVTDRNRLLVYTTNIPAQSRNTWLMQDHTYRLGMVSSAVGYYQQPMLGQSLVDVTPEPPAAEPPPNQTIDIGGASLGGLLLCLLALLTGGVTLAKRRRL